MNEIVQIIKQRINAVPEPSERMIIAVDGRCASGKTTLASALEKELDCTVFHMDDFFLRPEQRSAARLAAPGENVDHERFYEEVLSPLRRGEESIVYRAFNCQLNALMPPNNVKAGKIVVIEGSYSCHPSLWDHYDLHVFLTVSTSEQLRRIAMREGEERAVVFQKKWIPLEENYLRTYHVEERCELSFNTGELRQNDV